MGPGHCFLNHQRLRRPGWRADSGVQNGVWPEMTSEEDFFQPISNFLLDFYFMWPMTLQGEMGPGSCN